MDREEDRCWFLLVPRCAWPLHLDAPKNEGECYSPRYVLSSNASFGGVAFSSWRVSTSEVSRHPDVRTLCKTQPALRDRQREAKRAKRLLFALLPVLAFLVSLRFSSRRASISKSVLTSARHQVSETSPFFCPHFSAGLVGYVAALLKSPRELVVSSTNRASG